VVVAIYLTLAITVVLVLRTMSRRFRTQRVLTDSDAPYGPREPIPVAEREPETLRG
jgi:hypothetical protein